MRWRCALAVLFPFAIAAAIGTQVLSQPRNNQSPSTVAPPPASAQISRGRYLATLGDCIACHTRKGGAPFAGGRPLETPFGTILSANITPDRETGIGNWAADQFYRALHEGIANDGTHLYPAFPYNYYTRITRADSGAIFAYLRTLKPVHSNPKRNQLPFPFNIRATMAVWNWLFLRPGEYKPDPSKSALWNRGAYIVQGLGHCGACHTPMNILGAPKESQYLQGGTFGEWFAPDLTPNPRTGLGRWSHQDIVEFLKRGRNAHAAASAEMGEVVAFSLSKASDADLNAIAAYLHTQHASEPAKLANVDAKQMHEGEAIFADSCSACHQMHGEGVPRFFPPLRHDANLQQRDPTTTLHFILTGTQVTPTDSRPTPLSMPAYAWKLNDEQIAAVETYIRNAWGNHAPPVSAGDVAKLRTKLVQAGSQYEKPEERGSMKHPGPTTLAPSGTLSRDNATRNAGRPVGGPPVAGGPVTESGAKARKKPSPSAGGPG